MGLFSYDSVHHFLKMPYIWIWILSGTSSDVLLNSFYFPNYDEMSKLLDPASIAPQGSQCWQHWEEFNVRFRCLKSKLLANSNTSSTALHSGARFDVTTEKTPPMVAVKELKLVEASSRTDTASGSRTNWTMQHAIGSIDVSESRHIVMNAPGAPYGDAFVGIDIYPVGSQLLNHVHEVHQYKLVRGTVDTKLFCEERNKSISMDTDFFMVFTATKAT
jgi:hypothetical protein